MLNLILIQYDGSERPALEEGKEYVHFGFIVEIAQRDMGMADDLAAMFSSGTGQSLVLSNGSPTNKPPPAG